ncbi:MAG: hypothetical protein JXA11_05880, partial [Phycisphaerae bacterium]|nr:hypothetical protein [Phycisphaerae bacterium]
DSYFAGVNPKNKFLHPASTTAITNKAIGSERRKYEYLIVTLYLIFVITSQHSFRSVFYSKYV